MEPLLHRLTLLVFVAAAIVMPLLLGVGIARAKLPLWGPATYAIAASECVVLLVVIRLLRSRTG